MPLITLIENVSYLSIGKKNSQTKTASFHSAICLEIREFISINLLQTKSVGDKHN